MDRVNAQKMEHIKMLCFVCLYDCATVRNVQNSGWTTIL